MKIFQVTNGANGVNSGEIRDVRSRNTAPLNYSVAAQQPGPPARAASGLAQPRVSFEMVIWPGGNYSSDGCLAAAWTVDE